jgi:hypothetical protein
MKHPALTPVAASVIAILALPAATAEEKRVAGHHHRQ